MLLLSLFESKLEDQLFFFFERLSEETDGDFKLRGQMINATDIKTGKDVWAERPLEAII